MVHLPIISALTQEQLNEYKSRVAEWLASDQVDLTEGITLCTAIPQAAIFVSYHKSYTPPIRRKHIVQFLSAINTTPVEDTVVQVTPTVTDDSSDESDTDTDEGGVQTPSPSDDTDKEE